MHKKRIALLIIVTLTFSAFPITFFSFVAAKPVSVLPDYEPMDFNPEGNSINLNKEFKGDAGLQTSGLQTSTAVGDFRTWIWYDTYSGLWLAEYELYALGTECELWVMTDLSWGSPDDPRPTPVITTEQANYIVDEFDNTIYPLATGYFGDEELQDGSEALFSTWGLGDYYDEDGKTVILVSNVGDENYYDSTYPYYIAGFYWGEVFEDYVDRNVISIDAYDWENRLGPEASRPYLYEGVVAHEFQHLIHDDHFIESALWMNEGCSMFAEVLCGYPTDWSGINSFLATPDNSLTQWGDQGDINILADYGQVYLWTSYIVDNYDEYILKNYIIGGIPGVAGLNLLFADLDPATDFEAVFHKWTMANLMRTGYEKIDFDDKEAGDLRVYEVKDKWPTGVFGTDFGNTISVIGYDTGISRVSSYGTDYVLLSKLKWQDPSMLTFDGDDHAWTPHWDKDGSAWYSSSSDPLSTLDLFLDITLDGSSVLSFDTMYDIEPYWDFGFVQISIDGGLTWDSLDNDYTTDDDPNETYPDIVDNFPGLTGVSDGWISMSFDLPEHTGDAIIRFRYMTDWGTQWDGWWIDNVAIDGVFVSEDNFWDTYDPPETSFLVTVLRQDFWEGEYYYTLIAEFDVSGSNEFVLDLADFLSSPGEGLRYPDVVLAITPRLGLADYSFSVVPISVVPM